MARATPKGPRKRTRPIRRTPARVKQPAAKLTTHIVCPACAGAHLRADCPQFAELEPEHDRQWQAHAIASLHRRLPLS
jgi:hypothetical protein